MADWQPLSSNEEFFLDTEGVTHADVGDNIAYVDKVGKYHLEISTVTNKFKTQTDDGKDVSPLMTFDMLVLQDVEKQSPAGSHIFFKLYVGGKGGGPMTEHQKKTLIRVGVSLGILEYDGEGDDAPAVLKGTKNRKFPLTVFKEKLEGTQCIGDVKAEKGDEIEGKPGQFYKDKFTFPFGRGLWLVDDPAVKEVAKNLEMLQAIGKESAAWPVPGSAGAQGGTPKAPPEKKGVNLADL